MIEPDRPRWTLLTNHGAALALLASRTDATVGEMAQQLQVTERSVTRVLSDLRAAGYISVRREGRRNRYSVNLDAPLRHPVIARYLVRDLLMGVLQHADTCRDDASADA